MVRAIGKRKKFIFNAFVDFKPMQRFENMGDVTEFGSLNHSPGKRVLNEDDQTIEPGLVAFYVIRSGNGAGLFLQPRSPHAATLNNLLTLVYTETDNAWLLVRKQKLSY